MKVLLSAYACEPGKGSEPEVGLLTLRAAARAHDVWVITRENNLPGLAQHLADEPLRDRIRLVGLDVPGRLLRSKKRNAAFSQLYYDRWQRALADRAAELDRRVQFDLAHHVTFAAYWKRTGVATLGRPLVWGPVGGGVTTPRGLYGELGARGLTEELARNALRPLVATLPGIRVAQRDADVVLTQNAETARRLTTRHEPMVVPNALAARVPESAVPATRERTVVSVARLLPWKGTHLAVRAFAAASPAGTRMMVIGGGPERERIQRLANELGVGDRVTIAGRLPRDDVLRIVAGARVLLHAALHEEAGLAVSEALSYGTSVVCLDHGGPPELLRHWPEVASYAVTPGSRAATVRALADALTAALNAPAPKTAVYDPSRSFDELVLEAYELAVTRGR